MSPYPALFICHGGGPLPLLGDSGHKSIVEALKKNRKDLESRFGLPKAIAVVSAHYETSTPKIGGAMNPKMLYDYYGFPSETYKYQYSAPGNTDLAQDMVEALKSNGLPAEIDMTRPFDHGVFVPLMIMFPEAKIPIIPISVLSGGDPGKHILMGEALSKFRSNGVLFLGSGSTMHQFGNFKMKDAGKKFGDALTSVLCANESIMPREKRIYEMKHVTTMNGFNEAQPRNALEHLMPLLTIFGIANCSQAEEVANVAFGKANVRHYFFTDTKNDQLKTDSDL